MTGIFHIHWKQAIVALIYNAGDERQPKNYRRISILPVVTKILEKVIVSQLTRLSEDTNLLSKSLHGFRRHFSTETALI